MILGLDISTSITGYTILDDEGSVIEIGHIDLRKQKDFFDKARACQERFQELDRQSKSWIKKIYIEHTKLKGDALDDILKHDLWWNASICKKKGLVDKIWAGAEKKKLKVNEASN